MTEDVAGPQTDTLPIGPLQEGLWLFWQLNQDSPAYSMPEVFHFDGDFDLAAAEFAFNEVIRRHEALRTTFRETDAGAVQVVHRQPAPVPVTVVDLRGLPADEQAERVQSALDAAANQPFDLVNELAIRLTAIRVSESRTSLAMVAHHIVCDGASMTIIFDEFGALYRSARQGTPPDLGPAAPGYRAFVQEQLDALADGSYAEELAYWRERLAGLTNGSTLPGSDRTTSRPEALDTVTVSATLPAELTEAIWAYARRAKATPFTILLSALKVMIAVASGDADVAIGTATSGRTPRFARTVGMLTNMAVIRSRIDLTRSFAAVLAEVALDLMDAVDHQDLPFSKVVVDLREAGLESGADLLRTGFSAGAVGVMRLGEGNLSQVVARTAEGAYDLVGVAEITPVSIAIDWEYALRTYTREVADGYCAAYQEVLEALLDRPDATIDTLGLARILDPVVPARPGAAATGAAGATVPQRPADDRLTTVEQAVAAIWSEVIGVPVQTPEDDFFDLGGHSVLASRVVAMVRTRVAPSASLRLLFDHSQLREFASRLDVSPE